MTVALFYTGPSLRDLHEDYAKKHRIDDRAAIKGRREITVAAPSAKVWAMLSDVPHWDVNLGRAYWLTDLALAGYFQPEPDEVLAAYRDILRSTRDSRTGGNCGG
jgi:hypothetical protein